MDLIDYSRAYYEVISREPVPRIRKGKFVLVRRHGQVIVILGSHNLHELHADVLQRYCELNEIPFRHDPAPGRVEPKLNSGISVHGGGYFQIDDEAATVHLYSESGAYGAPDAATLAGLELQSGQRIIFSPPPRSRDSSD